MGVILFEINPFLAFLQRFLPRLLMGLLTAYIFILIKKHINSTVGYFVAGFSAAFLNTLLFMTALIVLFGNTDYINELMGGKNVIVFICTFVGINAIFEMLAFAVLPECRSCPGVSPRRCFAHVIAKSYPIRTVIQLLDVEKTKRADYTEHQKSAGA